VAARWWAALIWPDAADMLRWRPSGDWGLSKLGQRRTLWRRTLWTLGRDLARRRVSAWGAQLVGACGAFVNFEEARIFTSSLERRHLELATVWRARPQLKWRPAKWGPQNGSSVRLPCRARWLVCGARTCPNWRPKASQKQGRSEPEASPKRARGELDASLKRPT